MKRTIISYKNTADGKILFLGARNALSYRELEKVNPEVARLYADGDCYFFGRSHSGEINTYFKKDRQILFEDTIITKELFSEVVDGMKQAGDRLKRIFQEVESYKTKSIII